MRQGADVFGNVVKSQYPDLVPSFYSAAQITDLSYVKELYAQAPKNNADNASFASDAKMKQVVSRKAWDIQFQTGSATFTALVRGSDVDKQGMIQGTASLLFDFSAGKLSGHMDPVYMSYSGMGETEPLGRYDFANTIYARGSTSFSGQLSNSSFSQSGTFNGQFTGPAAQELMSTWSAPFHNPISNTDSQMFGVLVGKRP